MSVALFVWRGWPSGQLSSGLELSAWSWLSSAATAREACCCCLKLIPNCQRLRKAASRMIRRRPSSARAEPGCGYGSSCSSRLGLGTVSASASASVCGLGQRCMRRGCTVRMRFGSTSTLYGGFRCSAGCWLVLVSLGLRSSMVVN